MQRRPALVAGSLAATCLLLTGCGEPKGRQASPPPVASASPIGRPTVAPNAPEPTPRSSATPAAVTRTGPVGAAEGALDGGTVRLTVTELRRTGSTVVLNATLTRTDSGAGGLTIGDAFSDGRARGRDEADTFDGVALIDPVGRKKYLVARDSDGACVCSAGLAERTVERDVPVSLSATLTAPPAGVGTVDLFVPGIKTFSRVDLQD